AAQPAAAQPARTTGEPAKPAAPAAPPKPAAPASTGFTAPPPAKPAAPPPQPKTPIGSTASPPSTPAASATAAAAAAFFRGAGIAGEPLNDEQATELMQRLGQLVRAMIVGLSENLHVRADQKSTLRVRNTTIQPRANNPLKFSAGVDEALRNLLLREPAEYLSAVE